MKAAIRQRIEEVRSGKYLRTVDILPHRKRSYLPQELKPALPEIPEYCWLLAMKGCTTCMGTGWRTKQPCPCVGRAAWEQVCKRRHNIIERQNLADTYMKQSGVSEFSRPEEEYLADINLTLKHLPLEQRLMLELFDFKGLDWHQVIPALGRRRIFVANKGDVFHLLYRARAAAGQLLIERGIWPALTYFGHTTGVYCESTQRTTCSPPAWQLHREPPRTF